jgi:hypothetical protein
MWVHDVFSPFQNGFLGRNLVLYLAAPFAEYDLSRSFQDHAGAQVSRTGGDALSL